MRVLKWHFIFIILSMFFLLLGCSSQPIIQSNTSTNPQSSKLKQTLNKKIKQNGRLISLTKIKVQQEYDLQTYRMTYWSDGVKTVAYVAAPKVLGNYPLNVELHGGETLPTNKKHLTSITYEGETHSTASSSEIENSEPSVVTLAPMYRGYEKSDGTVQGLNGDTIDTENAIKALTSYFNSNKKLPHIKKGHIYLIGISMGGGVALKVASERNDIVDVIAESPFVGWDIWGAWDKKHNDSIYEEMTFYYGSYDPSSQKYKDQSINFKKIVAPVLLVQGTNDKFTPWETVQTFYNDMKSAHKNVTLKLIKGGNHGLSNKRSELIKDIDNFNGKYWAN
ncbi:prolyl oligopeptidase family serine peptidase [Pullulanibacillus sp. KACC 23026]|uniref:alpha/beta hydrolase family protein n=1 Tax=Pullulanibacillus sp. KACC 23026 TaxID=3028315 RepID=UPI0023B0DCF4|nr:alpha/beta family hydrolase [Pullulanibacillus sp. KACC 23026]WEG13655.1 prolyl oligopeptidase family serine peptidase [Pullulanibacillus sp. KACC 23026]